MAGFLNSEVLDDTSLTGNMADRCSGLIMPNVAGTCVSNAVTINKTQAVVTTESLTTAAGASQAITVTNNKVSVGDILLVTINGGTNTTGSVEIKAVATANTATITLTNRHASAAFNGTFILALVVIKNNNT